jgi:hypothetical protein
MLNCLKIALIVGILVLLYWFYQERNSINTPPKHQEEVNALKNIVNENKENPEGMNNINQLPVNEISAGVDTFWTRIVNMDNEPSKIYHYQLPNNFQINPKFLMFHPNFNITPSKTVQIISQHEGEAIAMLNLWVSLNLGLLDAETKFSQLFKTSIDRAVNHPSVAHKFKQDILNMLYFQPPQENQENLEFTEDLALSEIAQQNPPKPQQHEEPMFEAVGGGGGAFAPF